jgi:hypothetical protein
MWEWVLLAAKVIGLIGAFVGLTAEAPAGQKHKKRAWAFGFLAVAIGAELIDSQLKRQEAKEQAVRFERLAHPLGTIRVTPLFTLLLDGDELKGYRARLKANEHYLDPDPNSEPAATALLGARTDLWIAIYRDPKAVAKDVEPALAFEIDLSGISPTGLPAGAGAAGIFRAIGPPRQYNYHDGRIDFQTAPISNSPDDRFTTWEIVSAVDLLGAKLEIRVCPSVLERGLADSELAHLERNIRLSTVYVAFPGRQEFSISPVDPSVRSVEATKEDHCSYLFYTFPSTAEAFKKAQVP